MKKTIWTILFSIVTLGTTNALAQQPQAQQPQAQQPQAQQQAAAQPNLNIYTVCFFEGRAYSEGTFLQNVGKCQRKDENDSSGKRPLYWEPVFHQQR